MTISTNSRAIQRVFPESKVKLNSDTLASSPHAFVAGQYQKHPWSKTKYITLTDDHAKQFLTSCYGADFPTKGDIIQLSIQSNKHNRESSATTSRYIDGLTQEEQSMPNMRIKADTLIAKVREDAQAAKANPAQFLYKQVKAFLLENAAKLKV